MGHFRPPYCLGNTFAISFFFALYIWHLSYNSPENQKIKEIRIKSTAKYFSADNKSTMIFSKTSETSDQLTSLS